MCAVLINKGESEVNFNDKFVPRVKMPDCVCNYGLCESAGLSSDLYWRFCCLAMFFNST